MALIRKHRIQRPHKWRRPVQSTSDLAPIRIAPIICKRRCKSAAVGGVKLRHPTTVYPRAVRGIPQVLVVIWLGISQERRQSDFAVRSAGRLRKTLEIPCKFSQSRSYSLRQRRAIGVSLRNTHPDNE